LGLARKVLSQTRFTPEELSRSNLQKRFKLFIMPLSIGRVMRMRFAFIATRALCAVNQVFGTTG
jgi:hypothetical protein